MIVHDLSSEEYKIEFRKNISEILDFYKKSARSEKDRQVNYKVKSGIIFIALIFCIFLNKIISLRKQLYVEVRNSELCATISFNLPLLSTATFLVYYRVSKNILNGFIIHCKSARIKFFFLKITSHSNFWKNYYISL